MLNAKLRLGGSIRIYHIDYGSMPLNPEQKIFFIEFSETLNLQPLFTANVYSKLEKKKMHEAFTSAC